MRYPTFLEKISPRRTRAYVFHYPGLFVEAVDAAGALAALPEALRAEHAWLAAHGAPDPHAGEPLELWEVEAIDLGTDISRGRWRGAFRYERRPTTDADVERVLERTRWVRRDLDAMLDRLAGGLPGEIAALLAAHAGREWELLSRLGTRLAGDLPADPRERLAAVRAAAEARLGALLPGDRERHAVFAGEEWTARKVLRVFAAGERELYAAVASGLGLPVPCSFGGEPLTPRDRRSA